MEIRKLVKSGAASHTISLPKTWIEKNKLNKGDLLYIEEINNSIIVSSEKKKDSEDIKEKTINIEEKDIGTIRRETISAYINNYHLFTFIGSSLTKKLEDIRKILDNFLALEITEQTSTKLVAKDFLNLQEFSTDNTIRRMDMLTRSIIQDSKKGKSQTQELHIRDYEVDKLFFLMSRLTRSNLSDPSPKINNIESMSTWWLAKNFESIADSAKKLSKFYKEDIKDLYDEIEQFYLECARAYFKKDKSLADKMIAKRPNLLDKIDSLKDDLPKERLKEIVNFSRNISKIILDREIEG